MLELVNFTQCWVGGSVGGPVNATTWNTSFHGHGEVMGERCQLCARALDSTPHKQAWLRFEACTHGADGVAGIAFIPGNSERCARESGLDWARLRGCAVGHPTSRGLQMCRDSVFCSSAHCHSRRGGGGVCHDFVPPFGEGGGLPVVHVGGALHTGTGAFANLMERICALAPAGAACGCNETLLLERARQHRALARTLRDQPQHARRT